MILARDIALWALCYACFKLTIWWPNRWMPWPLLPGAGLYAYSDTFADFRETIAWNMAGRPSDWEWR